MNELVNVDGAACASISCIQEDGMAWALRVVWNEGVVGLPEARAWNEAIESTLAECARLGAAFVDSRVITASEGVDEGLASARASMHRDSLILHGFERGEDRFEYRMDLGKALATLEAGKMGHRLAWECVDAGKASELARAASLLCQASVGDPASHPDDDATGFLEALFRKEGAAEVPERLQVGSSDGHPAAILALLSRPADGWSTIYYLGILPAFRGCGLGVEAMLHGLTSLKAMGGRTYHDGTGSRNAAARSLFARLGQPPSLVMEEWRLRL
ncbi:MAG TPA: GNAT family N-acetyltransferase [Rectinemataceae bacterium]|nr:GNAT family N-acetyltransferase [Rectinemataceae bacterium]